MLLRPLATLGILRNLNKVTAEYSATLERISSGSRINSAADDPAGIALLYKTKTQKAVYSQASRNIRDGTSVLQSADSALDALTTILARQSELATQASSSNISSSQRTALNDEAQALYQEYARIISTTTYNNVQLFGGAYGASSPLTLQAGFTAAASISVALGTQLSAPTTITTPGTGSVTTGTGSFAAPITNGAVYFNNFDREALGDVNGDGKLDLVSVNQVYLGDGAGHFTFSNFTGFYGGEAWLADFNGDGKLDIAYQEQASSGKLHTALGNGDGTFGAPTSYGVAPTSARDSTLKFGDFNLDGKVDIAYGAGQNDTIEILSGSGTGSFSVAHVISTPTNLDFSVGDLNGDGKLDIVTSYFPKIFYGQAGGTFSAAVDLSAPNGILESVAIGDINGDGKNDIIGASDSADVLYFYSGNGDGTYGSAVTYGTGNNLRSLRLGDINGDGKIDLIAQEGYSTANDTKIYLNNGSGFTLNQTFNPPGANAGGSIVGDVNGDGVLDIVALNDLNAFSYLGVTTTSGGSPPTVTTYNTGIIMPPIDLTSAAKAQTSLSIISAQADKVTLERGTVGATLSRLGFALNHSENLATELESAASRISDLDVAREIAKSVSLQIIRDAAVAVFAQANQDAKIVLKLLQ